MELTWLQGLILGCVSGLAEIIPVSAEAHRRVILKLFGMNEDPVLLRLFVHIATVAALYYLCRSHITRMTRASRLAKVPKRRRKRPLDTRALMDMRLLKTALIPVVIGFLFYHRASALTENLLAVAGLLLINGIILYIPQFLPGSNKDSQAMSPLEGLCIGLGGAASTLPGISCVGTGVSIGTMLGMDQKLALDTALVMHIPVSIGLILFDMIAIVGGGLASISFAGFVACLMAGVAAFMGILLGHKLLNRIIEVAGYPIFGLYCWTVALFSFILYLTAA